MSSTLRSQFSPARLVALGLLGFLAPTLIAPVTSGASAHSRSELVAAPKPAPSPSPKAPASATFGIGPVNATGAFDARSFFNYVTDPGGALSDRVAVVNYALEPVTLAVYATDNAPGGDGLGLLPENIKPMDAGKWVTMGMPANSVTVTVAPRGTLIIPFSIAVPKTVSPGDHNVGIIAALASTARTTQGEVVHLSQRVAVRAYLRVTGKIAPGLTVKNFHATYHQNYSPLGKGGVSISYTVVNTGNVKLVGHQAVEFGGLLGARVRAPAVPDLPLMPPGASQQFSMRLPGVLPELFGHATVKLTPLPAPQDVDGKLAPVVASKFVGTIPITLLIIVVAAGVYLWWRRRRKKGPGPVAPAPAVPIPVEVAP